MERCELRKKLLRYYELLREIKSIKTMTSSQRNNQTKEIRALEEKIRNLKEILYDSETNGKYKWIC